jgi:hypothetical protein
MSSLNFPKADTVERLRTVEAQAAVSYFGALRDRQVLWPKADLRRVPEHWRTVGTRQSPLSGSPRLAITPVHAILNYCFALLESETRLALVALGLDPGLGLGLHTDTPNRDSLAFDVLEPVRPQTESWLLNWIAREPLRRADFFETGEGNCRLMSSLCRRLGETAPVWGNSSRPGLSTWRERCGPQHHRQRVSVGRRPTSLNCTGEKRREVWCRQVLLRLAHKRFAVAAVPFSNEIREITVRCAESAFQEQT